MRKIKGAVLKRFPLLMPASSARQFVSREINKVYDKGVCHRTAGDGNQFRNATQLQQERVRARAGLLSAQHKVIQFSPHELAFDFASRPCCVIRRIIFPAAARKGERQRDRTLGAKRSLLCSFSLSA